MGECSSMRRSVGRRRVHQRNATGGAAASDGQSRRPRRVATIPWARLLLAGSIVASWTLVLALSGLVPATASAAAQDAGALHIVVPSGASGNPSGPVGAFVTVQAGSLTPGGAYTLGVALQDAGCQGGFTAMDANAAADASGGFVKTFQWPSSAGDTGSSYYVCAQSQTDKSFVQSDQAFTVLGAHAPRIALSRPQATPGPGTPPPLITPPTLPAGVFYAGDSVQITGRYFLPGGTSLTAYLAAQPITSAQDLQSAIALKTPDGSSITSDANGGFTAVVTLPTTVPSGSYYVYVVSDDSDAGTNAPPSLEASKQTQVQQAPTPTPTATSTPTAAAPTATPKTGGGTSGTSTGGGNKPIGAIIGLGITSVVLFLVGVILLASAATTPRPEQR